MRALRTFIALASVLTLLAGCATTPLPRSPATVTSPEQLERWHARGRIGVSGAEGGGGSGSFEWRQQADEADVQIRGPVGIGSVRLQVSGEAASPQLKLQTGDGVMVESDAAWTELEARLGANLPAGNLRYWMLGLAAPGPHEWTEPNEAGEVSLQQQGWLIEYQRYSNEFGAKLPMRLQASSGAARVRIVIDRWQLGQ
jgi:outer membrane lipoprotein LolB